MNRVPVSTVIPCFRSSHVGRAVQSVLAQTSLPGEIILVDDGSGDATPDVLRRIAAERSDCPVRVIVLERNVGPGAARNEGWRAARQPYIAFLDHDDSWHPRKLEIQHAWMAAHPDVVLTSHVLVQGPGGASMPPVREDRAARRVAARDLLISNRFQTSTVMLRASLPFRFDTSRARLEDYLLWLEIVLSGNPAWRLETPLAMQHKAVFGESGLSGQLWKMEKGELAAYRHVLDKGLIAFPTFVAVCALSLVKFLRRLVVSLVRGPTAGAGRARRRSASR